MSKNELSPFGHNNIIVRYWQTYGGFRSLLLSPYLWLALAITFILNSTWLIESSAIGKMANPTSVFWWDTAIAVLPNLLGFSLGGYVMWMGVEGTTFKSWLHRRSTAGESSVFMDVSAIFLHFVVIQLLALVFAVVAKHSQFELVPDSLLGQLCSVVGLSRSVILKWLAPFGYGLGFFLFVYALLTAIEAALGIFQVSSWQDFHAQDSIHKGRNSNSRSIGRQSRRKQPNK